MKKLQFIISALIAISIIVSCNITGNKQEKKATSITGAGATFPQPFYNKIFKTYTKESSLLVTYGGIGSGGGIRSLKDEIVDFGATDAFLSDAKLAKMPAEVLHIPTCLGAVVAAYNIPGKPNIKLSPSLLEGIFMGKITKWDDAKIKMENMDETLPNIDITVVYRSDGSGTTFIFSDYMSKVSANWKEQIGAGKSLMWPVGIGAKGNPGVAGTINQTEGAIGYIGSEYAFAQKIQTAKIKNFSGNYVAPSVQSVSLAAQAEIPADTRISLTNSKAEQAYPISSFTWIILYKDQFYNNRSKSQAKETIKLLKWMLSPEAQRESSKVHYAPLPPMAVKKANIILNSVTYKGELLK